MARLVLTTPEGQQIVELRPVNSLGRHPSNSIQLLDKIVSKEHCIIEQRGNTFVLKDLGSLNGTFINRDRVQGEQTLNDGDDIALGSTRARFEQTPPAAQPAPQHQVVGGQQPWSQAAPQPNQGQPVPSAGWGPMTAPAGAGAVPPSVGQGQAPAYQRAAAPQPPGPPPHAGGMPGQAAGSGPTSQRRPVPP
ncbi:MAG: FHA domain-containing protein, partial [Deltaproteobacteria bacterium]|nr:FHA domain-containing protein [Deltaproteobacteria bacterium]MBW2535765.1 FHA domain-containing protein [Deltaproteobacteria bacterium]